MKLTGALVILGTVLFFLTSGGDCGICLASKHDSQLFPYGTPKEFLENVEKYKDDSETLESKEKLKKCIDSTLTEEDKAHATDFVMKATLSC
uniref:Uncharacterized protein n=1 Tax=Mus spicilegus TaxID=10103 RepID=A0A8C6I015_MUSSI